MTRREAVVYVRFVLCKNEQAIAIGAKPTVMSVRFRVKAVTRAVLSKSFRSVTPEI